MKPSERKGLIISSTLHGVALVWLIVATFFWHASANSEPVVFDLMPGPKAPFEIPGEKAPGEITDKKPGSPAVGNTKVPDLSAPNIPDAPVEPTEPESTPPPAKSKPSPKPTPKSEPKPEATAKQMSYEDFLKNSKDGKRIKNTPSTTTRSNSQKTTGERVKISAADAKKMLDRMIAGGEGGGGGGAADSKGVGMRMGGGGNASALNSYMSKLKARIDAAWEKPDDASNSGISAIVQFTVGDNGLITARRIVKSSGSSNFDQTVLNVFDRLGYVGTPPGGGNTFKLTFSLDD